MLITKHVNWAHNLTSVPSSVKWVPVVKKVTVWREMRFFKGSEKSHCLNLDRTAGNYDIKLTHVGKMKGSLILTS